MSLRIDVALLGKDKRDARLRAGDDSKFSAADVGAGGVVGVGVNANISSRNPGRL